MARTTGSRDDIRQKIVLEGGDQIKRQLAELGRAGEEAIRAIDRAVNQANLGRFDRTIQSVGANIARTFGGIPAAFQPLHDTIGRLGQRFTDLGRSLTNVIPHFRTLAAFGTAGGVAALVAGINKANEAIDDLVDTSKNLGLTVEQLQALRLMGRQTGSDVDRFALSIARLNTAVATAALKSKDFEVQTTDTADVLRGGKQALDDFSDSAEGLNILRGGAKAVTDTNDALSILRLNAKELAKLSPFEIIARITPRLLALRDATLQNKVSMELFGRGFQEILPTLQDGTKGLRDAEKEVQRLKIAPTGLEKFWSAEFLKARGSMVSIFEGAFNAIGVRLGTVLVPLMDSITTFIQQNIGVWREWATQVATEIRPGMAEIGALITGAVTPGEIQTQWVRDLVSLFNDLKAAALIVAGAVKGLIAVLDGVAAGINAVFGTDVNGRTLLIAAAVLYLTGIFGLLLAAVKLVITAVGALSLLFSPVGLIVGIAAVGAALLVMNDNWKNITGTIEAFLRMAQSIATYLATGFINVLNSVAAALERVINLASRAPGAAPGVVSPGLPGFATGGRIRGPGTGTSDSILLRGSNGEFIVNAFSTRLFLPLLEMINRFPRFARGGLIDTLGSGSAFPTRGNLFGGMAGPRRDSVLGLLRGGPRAAGSGVSGRVAIDLTMPGGQKFGDLLAPPTVARKMLTYARGQSVKSLGTAPSFAR